MEIITYLVANYNNEKYITECIDSIIKQECSQWECIICDNASTDSSLNVIRPYLGSKIKLITNSQKLGYTNTLKKLIKTAETDIVAIIDPDDALCLDATESVLEVYKENIKYSRNSFKNN